MIKIIVMSDIRIYCEGLGKILADINSIQLLGLENSFERAFEHIEQEIPDVLLLDMTMKGGDKFARELCDSYPTIKTVALAVPDDDKDIIAYAEAGIVAYVAREASVDDLVDTVIKATHGKFSCPQRVASCLIRKIRELTENNKIKNTPAIHNANQQSSEDLEELTKRERQVVDLMASGLSNKQISRRLNIEVSTVKTHVHNILCKLNTDSRMQAISLLSQSSRFTSLHLSV